MKTILITGASGFFGKSLLEALHSSSEEFKVIGLYHVQCPQIVDSRFEWLKADLQDLSLHSQLMQKIRPTHCVHLAWYVPPQKFWTAWENIEWLNSSLSLFRAFAREKGKVFIGAGSLAEYDWATGVLDEEKTPLNPATLYGQCKKSLHEILLAARDAHYPETTILWPRIGYFFGEDEPQEKLIRKLIASIKNGLSMDLAAPDFSRPYAHVKYLGQALATLVMEDSLEDAAFNMSASIPYSLKEVVDFIQEYLSRSSTCINYDVYPSLPVKLTVKNQWLVDKGMGMPDTFFTDLKGMLAE